MTRDELWKVFTDANPKLLDDGNTPVTLRLRGIKKMFDAAYDAGEENAYAEISRDVRGSSDMPEFMKGLFRK